MSLESGGGLRKRVKRSNGGGGGGSSIEKCDSVRHFGFSFCVESSLRRRWRRRGRG